MFCPRCGRQPVADDLRFCSYCGFKLGVVKASLAEEEEVNPVGASKAEPVSVLPRHRNTNIGVILMFLSALLALILSGRGFGIHRTGGGLILTLFYAAILVLSSPISKAIYRLFSWGEPTADRLSVIRREVGFGATLMFLSTILSAVMSLLTAGRMRTTSFEVAILVAFVLLVVIAPYLMNALRYVVRDDGSLQKSPSAAPSSISEAHQQALPAIQQLPISVVGPTRVTTAEIVAPVASVTEHTTGLLREK